MLRHLLTTGILVAATASAANAASTVPVKITVPIQLQNVDPSYTRLVVGCFVTTGSVDQIVVPSSTGAGDQPGVISQYEVVPLTGQTSFTGSASFTIAIPAATFANYKGYACSMIEFATSSNVKTPASSIPAAAGSRPTLRATGAVTSTSPGSYDIKKNPKS